MRAKVKVIGVEYFEGKSKRTGKDYAFYQLYCLYPRKNVHGEACFSATVNEDMMTDILIYELPLLDMVFHEYNGKVYVDAIL